MADIVFEQRGAIGVVTLNRPEALNALSHEMAKAYLAQLSSWSGDPTVQAVVITAAGEKAFCAGGDIRAAADAGLAYAPTMTSFFRDEYALNRAIKRFNKPYVALIDGVVMGGGAGLSIHCDYRVGGDRLLFAMPELGIGLIPDVGASFFLPRLPRQIGRHLALTGARLGVADGVTAHLIDYYVRSEQMSALIEQLAAADFGDDPDGAVCEVLAMNASAPPTPPLKAHLGEIEEAYSAQTLQEVLAALDGGSEWARAQAAAIRKACPSSARITWALLTDPPEDIETALLREFRAASFAVSRPDFYEGVRAVLVEKRAPVWSPARIEDVTDADIAAAFAAPADGDLAL